MKILFVTDYLLARFGGARNSALAHVHSLERIAGKGNIDIVAIHYEECDKESYPGIMVARSKTEFIKNVFRGNIPQLSDKFNLLVYEMLKNENYDVLFLDNSWFGKIAKHVKRNYPQMRIVTYFHGVKHNSVIQKIKLHPLKGRGYLDYISCIKNERETIKNSDKLLLLNKRESEMLWKYYHRNTDFYLPVYFIDTAKKVEIEIDRNFNILFVGGALEANIKGITWFIQNVLVKLDADVKLFVVGNTMDRLNDNINLDKRVHAIGRVETLDEYYHLANIVVGPIFEGDGMKTKTAEALMYGKIYLGTDEALCGYEGLDEYRCNTADEFVNKINEVKYQARSRYSQEMRNLYLQNHSIDMADYILRQALQDGINRE